MSLWFERFARAIGYWCGRPVTFVASVACIILWATLGPRFGYSDTWQLVINTGTTIISFLTGFVMLHNQANGERAINAKLDELIRVSDARNDMRRIEQLPEAEIERIANLA